MAHNVKSDLHIRPMKAGELDLAIEQAGREKWNPGLNDAECFFAADPDGFFLAELDGEPVGCISAVRYGEQFGFLGLYIVFPGHRGNGYGMKLWNKAMEHLSGRNVGLDGVVAQQENYKKSGFKLSHRNIRYERTAEGRSAALVTLGYYSNAEAEDVTAHLSSASEWPFEKLQQYDAECFSADRSDFLKCWISQPGCVSAAAIIDGKLSGYGVMRPCYSGFKVGPLFADSVSVARQIFSDLITRCAADGPVFLDVPETNLEAVQLALDCKMEPMF